MKKQLLFAVATAISVGSFAQSTAPNMNGLDIAKPHNKTMITGFEEGSSQRGAGAGSGNGVAVSSNGTVIGGTTYDLQTNASVQNRLVRHADGTLSAVWTYSNAFTTAAPDRGTGYNYFNGTTWQAAPTARIETERGGWPSMLGVNGGEVNTLHNTTSAVITMNKRSTKGTGTWTETNVSSASEDIIWNRSAAGGPNGQTIHFIGVTAPIANGGSLYQGLDGALVYYRSLDGGTTWDQQAVVLPGMTSTEFVGFTGDAYSIQASGNTVAIAVFNDWADSFIMKSTDNGTTWTKTLFIDFPLDMYVTDQPGGSDATGDGIADTLNSTDGSGALVIDGNGMAHVFYGNMRILDADVTDGNSSYFPYTNGLVYWNENMPADSGQIIAWAEDFDGDGVAANGNETDIALYFASLASFPNATIDATGSIYVTYSAYMENLDNGAQSYRHVYIVKSDNGGCSWNEFEDVTPNDNFAECIFASIASTVDDSVRFIYQEDFEPGLAVRGDEDSFDNNDIVYVSVAKNSLSNTILNCVSWVEGDPIFCPGANADLTASCGTAYAWSTGATTPTITLTNPGTYTVDITNSCGTTTHTIVAAAPTTAPTIVPNGATTICGTTPATLSVEPVTGGSYLWSTGATTLTTTVTAAGTYTITVTNCGGTSSSSIVVANEPTPANTVNTIGQTTFCEGSGTIVLSALEGASWLWSNGATTQSITLSMQSESGSYTCDISNSCGDMVTSTPISVTINPKPTTPVVTYSGNGVYSCTAADGYQWYLDGSIVPGATSQTFDASVYQNSTVSVYVTNAEGCISDESAGAVVGVSEIKNSLNNVSIYPNPNNGIFAIEFNAASASTYEMKITNMLGQVMFTDVYSVSGNSNRTVNMNTLTKGMYFVTVSSQGEENVYKLIVE